MWEFVQTPISLGDVKADSAAAANVGDAVHALFSRVDNAVYVLCNNTVTAFPIARGSLVWSYVPHNLPEGTVLTRLVHSDQSLHAVGVSGGAGVYSVAIDMEKGTQLSINTHTAVPASHGDSLLLVDGDARSLLAVIPSVPSKAPSLHVLDVASGTSSSIALDGLKSAAAGAARVLPLSLFGTVMVQTSPSSASLVSVDVNGDAISLSERA